MNDWSLLVSFAQWRQFCFVSSPSHWYMHLPVCVTMATVKLLCRASFDSLPGSVRLPLSLCVIVSVPRSTSDSDCRFIPQFFCILGLLLRHTGQSPLFSSLRPFKLCSAAAPAVWYVAQRHSGSSGCSTWGFTVKSFCLIKVKVSQYLALRVIMVVVVMLLVMDHRSVHF